VEPAAVHGAAVSVVYLGLLPAALGLFPTRLGRAAVAFLAVCLTAGSANLRRWAAAPPTDASGWRGPVDLIAVGGSVLTAVPILVVAVLTFSGGSARAQAWWAWAALVVAHVAMAFGMMAPSCSAGPTPRQRGTARRR
jgi:hypothetical protein